MGSDFWVAAGAVGTFIVAVVALFANQLRRYVLPARLQLQIHPRSPAFQLVQRNYDLGHFEGLGSIASYWFRLWIYNAGGSSANGVQVFVAKLEQKIDGDYETVASFLPANLVWTHDDATERQAIHKGMGAYVELGYFDAPNAEAAQHLCLRVEGSSTDGHLLTAGRYRLTVRVAAEYVGPVDYVIEINVDGGWDPNPDVMFAKHVVVRPRWGVPFDLP